MLPQQGNAHGYRLSVPTAALPGYLMSGWSSVASPPGWKELWLAGCGPQAPLLWNLDHAGWKQPGREIRIPFKVRRRLGRRLGGLRPAPSVRGNALNRDGPR